MVLPITPVFPVRRDILAKGLATGNWQLATGNGDGDGNDNGDGNGITASLAGRRLLVDQLLLSFQFCYQTLEDSGAFSYVFD